MSTTTVTLAVEGMTCGHCESHVRTALEQTPGVSRVTVSLEDGTGTIEYDASRVTPKELMEAVREAGYAARIA